MLYLVDRLFEVVGGVALGHLQKFCLYALLGGRYLHAPAYFILEEGAHELPFAIGRNDELGGRLVGRIVLSDKGCERLGVGHVRLVEGERTCALHYALARDEHVDGRVEAVGSIGDDVGVDGLVYGGYPPCLELGEHGYLVLVVHGQLEGLVFGGGEHLLFEHALRGGVVAAQKFERRLYPLGVLLPRYLVRAGGGTAADMVIEALLFGFGRYGRAAQSDAVDELKGFQNVLAVYAAHKWPEVLCTVLLYFARYIEGRKLLAHVRLDIRVCLVVL